MKNYGGGPTTVAAGTLTPGTPGNGCQTNRWPPAVYGQTQTIPWVAPAYEPQTRREWLIGQALRGGAGHHRFCGTRIRLSEEHAMTRHEHLLVIAIEECNGVALRLSKALRFGLQERQPGQSTNVERIREEYSNLASVLEMIAPPAACGGTIHPPSGAQMDRKRDKVEHFLAYSNVSQKVFTEQEWLARYKARIMAVAHVRDDFAEACAQAEPFAVLSEFFEDDPEGAADEEMSYWDGRIARLING